MKRILSLIVALSLVLAVVPFGVFADGTLLGSGTEADPYVIEDISEPISAVITSECKELYYNWVAPGDGTLTVIAYSDNPEGYDILIDEDVSIFDIQDDDPYATPSYSVDVTEGESFQINVYYVDPVPAGTEVVIKFSVDYTEPAGTESNPLALYGNGYYNQITLGVNETVYCYGAGYFNGMIMIVTGGDASIAHNGSIYTTSNGAANLSCVQASTSAYAVFAITNIGADETTYTVRFVAPVGTMDNPAEMELGANTVTLEAGDSRGYFFTWTAPASGTLTITMPDGDWSYAISNLTTYVYGETQYSNSDPVMQSCSLDVAKGDLIQLTVNTFNPKDIYNPPGGTLVITADFIASASELKGDLNGDDKVNDADVVLLLWHTLFPDRYTLQPDADFNGDKYVNDADVAVLLWHTLFPTTYPLN